MPNLSTLVANVVLESTKGVATAELEAAADRAAFRESLGRPPASFVSEGDVERFLRERFPPFDRHPRRVFAGTVDPATLRETLGSWEPGETAIRVGSPYVHPERFPTGGLSETPPVERELGVRLTGKELEVTDGLALLTPSAVRRVREAAATRLGERHLEARRSVAEEGYPRPVVERMDVETKVSFRGPALDTTPLDARFVDDAIPEAVGTVRTKLHFEDEDV